MGKKYPAEVHNFIVANYKGRSSGELAEMVNEKFGTDFTGKRILSYKKDHHLKSGARCGVKKNTWSPTNPPGLYEFIRDECQGLSRTETAEAVNERFGPGTMTKDQAAAYRKNHNLPCGRDTRFKKGQQPVNGLQKGEHFAGCERTWFQKGHISANHANVGTERRRSDGYQIRKVKERGTQWERWIPIARIVYQETFGEIPEGMIVGFKDGNRDNLKPENLFLMTNEENLEMNRTGKRSRFPEITETRLTLAKVRITARKKGRSKHGTN